MAFRCPKCEQQELTAGDQSTLRCSACHGLFVPQTALQAALAADDLAGETVDRHHDEQGALCPQDHSIMVRTRVTAGEDDSFHLERCGSCYGVWFDAGEWSKLASHQLLTHLDEFWSAEYRKRDRLAEDRATYENRMKKVFGAELFYQLRSVATALREHPRRSQALAFIREESD